MNIGICGICGRMGEAVLRKVIERGHSIVAGFESGSSPNIGKDIAAVPGAENISVTISALNDDDIKKVDGIIDFSSPAATLNMIELAAKYSKPVAIGTTGFSVDEIKIIKDASGKIPVLLAPNMSVGVNILFRLTEIASKALKNEFDIEVVEAHHRFKKDAPSGTAKKLVEIIKESIPELENCREVSGRDGITGERTKNEIGVFAMRGGDIVGEHTVFFAGMGERIELTHRAASRDNFASGAVMAMEFLNERAPGMYSMFDILGL